MLACRFVAAQGLTVAAASDLQSAFPLSPALSPALNSAGTYFEIPESWYPPIEQAAVVLATHGFLPAAI
jgi:hypothetical protein